MRHWIAVASAEHVSLGRSLGMMQVCHGRAAPLRRIRPGDQVIYYSPVSRFRGKDPRQAFTAIGTVADGVPYQVEMTAGFKPWRRDVHWHAAHEAPIRPLLGRLAFTGDGANWGYRFRFGLFEITGEDAALIAAAAMADVTGSTGRPRQHSPAVGSDLPFGVACRQRVWRVMPSSAHSISMPCTHSKTIRNVTPSAKGCEECLRIGSAWVHLRLCRACGHVGCCDQSPHRHARAHFEATEHPIIEGYDPPEGWGWCYVDDIEVDLPDQTPQRGPIPRFY